MTNVLTKIIEHKQQEVAKRKIAFPLNAFVDKLVPSDRSFKQALSEQNAGFILECKKASPSKGLIRADFDLNEIGAAYAPHASAISVLTDNRYFQGQFEHLHDLRNKVKQPILNKDFFIDSYQVSLARYHGADAILLMLSVLTDEQYRQLSADARLHNMDVLTEVSNLEEAMRAISLNAEIIGINNRNLRDLSTDLANTEHLAPLIKAKAPQALIISESGIYNHQDVRRLAPLVNGFLVGSALMMQSNMKQAVTRLIYGDSKVCGITNVQDATAVANSGASYAGLIFVGSSARCVDLAQASQIVRTVPFNYVGVFADANIEQLVDCAKQLNLTAVQLHGNEDQHYINELRKQLTGLCQIWLARGVNLQTTQQQLPELHYQNIDKLILDARLNKQRGGTGQAFEWQLLQQVCDKSHILLAGGLNTENIERALQTGVSGWDINSGAETSPGVKDPTKITQLFDKIRQY